MEWHTKRINQWNITIIIIISISISIITNIEIIKPILIIQLSIIVMIVHFFVGQLSLLGLIQISVELLFRVESVSVFTCIIAGLQDWDRVPSVAIQIRMILWVSACFIFVFVHKGIPLSIHWVFNLMRILIGNLIGGLPALLNKTKILQTNLDEHIGSLFYHIY